MNNYIGVEMIQAIPMLAKDAANKGYKIEAESLYTEGYEIIRPNGINSWYPKDVFDKIYLKLNDGDGEQIIKEDIDDFIFTTHNIKLGRKTANVSAICRTGFEINAQSTSMDADKFVLYKSGNIAYTRITNVIQNYLEFVLEWAKNGINRKSPLPYNIQNKLVEHKELEARYRKLDEFINENPKFMNFHSDERNRMIKQRDAMKVYYETLGDRINNELDNLNID